jgi:hypothetical protein
MYKKIKWKDGIPGPNTDKAMKEFADKMNEFSIVMKGFTDRIDQITRELYADDLAGEDAGVDADFPHYSPDDSMTPLEYYWHFVFNEAKNNSKGSP